MPNVLNAGANQSIVVYVSSDTGMEVDPMELYAEVARDAEQRSQSGQRIVSMASVPVRHAGVLMGRQGSGFETKIAVAVVYAG